MTKTLGLIGAGAFGALAAMHLAPYLDLTVHDNDAARSVALATRLDTHAGTLGEAAACELVLMAAPVPRTPEILKAIAPLVRPGALAMDVGRSSSSQPRPCSICFRITWPPSGPTRCSARRAPSKGSRA